MLRRFCGKRRILPQLEGLGARLDAADAAFLDVGAGVAALSIAMAWQWPSLRIVAVEPWAPSVAIARERIKSAGLDERIELREQSVEDMTDQDVFDLVWIPSGFIPGQVVRAIMHRAVHALRPGGWLLLAALAAPDDPLAAALTRLRATLWGGCLFAPGEAEQLLTAAGLRDVRKLPGPPGAAVGMVAGRK
jgi:2-polyprenyl-3-methyl-5-hydroxy-6-metoxy-1,4-benzoquinol methylase